MFEVCLPKKFCREFAVLNGPIQLSLFMAVVKGLKPVLDHWIEKKRLDSLKKICRKYGLILKPDVVFKNINQSAPRQAIGSDKLTTTVATGHSLALAGDKDFVHVFIAKKKEELEKAFQNGWYPVVIKNRVIEKPYIDLLKFGYALGYPACCVKFFRQYNHWDKYSFLYQVFENTKAKTNYLCNCLTKNTAFSYMYHMPCSFNCKATRKLNGRIRDAIKEEEPEFVKNVDRHLKLPFLVFNELEIYGFEGQIRKNKLFYKRVYFTVFLEPERSLYLKDLSLGNSLTVEDNIVTILKNGRLIKKIKCSAKGTSKEIPFLVDFN